MKLIPMDAGGIAALGHVRLAAVVKSQTCVFWSVVQLKIAHRRDPGTFYLQVHLQLSGSHCISELEAAWEGQLLTYRLSI